MSASVKKLITLAVLVASLLLMSVKRDSDGRVECIKSLVWEYRGGELSFKFGSPDRIVGAIVRKISEIVKVSKQDAPL